ncbi:MAG: M20/M25/M40 family metallo-hydrolase [Planctomycetota bacterium]
MSGPATKAFDHEAARALVEHVWDEEIVPNLIEYIRIPCLSPAFDAGWERTGELERAVQFLARWCRTRPIPGMKLELVRLPGRTPLLLAEVPGRGEGTVLLYGHYDKQPEMTGWREDLGPWKPKLEGDRLYGRGGSDDGYATFGSLTALHVLAEQGLPGARCIMLIEGCEESGSADLSPYIDHLAARLGTVDLVICLDSGCGDYDRLWTTRSLRGLAAGELRVDVLREGVHSGDASGIVPDSFRILRLLLDRLEDGRTGTIVPRELFVDVPPAFREQARAAAAVLGPRLAGKFPFAGGTKAVAGDPAELVLNQTWRPTLTVIGQDGLPPLARAGNVLRPGTSVKLSLRLPPTLEGEKVGAFVKELLEADPPHGARVSFTPAEGCSGWASPPVEDWLEESLVRASRAFFGPPPAHRGEGGTIPLMGMLTRLFPAAQFVITGVGGPESNAHGPNEFLHVPTGKRVTACVARILYDHMQRSV